MKTKTISHGGKECNAEEFLRCIEPGKTYPTTVLIQEKGKEITFSLASYLVGMYCAVYWDQRCQHQTGDHDNKTFVRNFKKDIRKALTRGAKVVIGRIATVEKES